MQYPASTIATDGKDIVCETPDVPFGVYAPNNFFQFLISTAQNGPQNWIGQQFAQIVRRITSVALTSPVDLEIHGLRLRCDLHDNASERKFAFMPWRFDKKERDYLRETLPEDGVFIDIGANVGIYSLWVSSFLGNGGRILALEPNPPAFKRLSFNIASTLAARKQPPEVTALCLGVADKDGDVSLYLTKNLGSCSMLRDQTDDGKATPSTIVKCKRLIAILRENNIAKVDALKIDVEGAEDIALIPFFEHVPAVLYPGTIIIENSEDKWHCDLFGLFKKLGYEIVIRSRMNTVWRLARNTPFA
jgi:FkbM family methyltransferase